MKAESHEPDLKRRNLQEQLRAECSDDRVHALLKLVEDQEQDEAALFLLLHGLEDYALEVRETACRALLQRSSLGHLFSRDESESLTGLVRETSDTLRHQRMIQIVEQNAPLQFLLRNHLKDRIAPLLSLANLLPSYPLAQALLAHQTEIQHDLTCDLALDPKSAPAFSARESAGE